MRMRNLRSLGLQRIDNMYSEKPKLHARQGLWKPGDLKSISLDVTSKCNMSCPHCYARTFRNRKLVDLDVLKKALDEL